MERALFFDRLRQSRLLTESELEQAASRFGEARPGQDIAADLVRAGVLTAFQARQVCSEDTQPLALGQYHLLDELGRGGMGRVYKALHTIMGRVVAIKVIAAELVRDPVAVEWFRREVRASTHLVHPNIVMAFDANEAEGLHFLVMEYVHGLTLDAVVRQRGRLPIAHACALMRQAALGLQHAHDKDMVHRDIKPANLLLPHTDGDQPPDALVKIVDFGLARLQGKTKGDTIALRGEAGVLGTPDYIAPEQSRDIHAADIRSDLYSLGCSFYFALAGRVPFPGDNAMEKLIKHLMEEPEPLERVRPDVPPAVAAIVRRLMAKEPSERYQTPAELARELEQWAVEQQKGIPATHTAARPLWISPPTQLAPPLPSATDEAMTTRMLDRVEVFAPSRPPVEASGPSLLEPLWKHAPGEERQHETHDTLSFSKAEDTEEVTAEATALEKEPSSAARGDCEDTQPEGCLAAAAASAGTEQEAGEEALVDPVLRRLWGRWTALVEIIVVGRGPSRVKADEYRAVHASLVQVCRAGLEATAADGPRAFYQEMLSIVQPWLNLQTFHHPDAGVLLSLVDRCKQIELELNDGKLPWTLRQGVGLALLMLSPMGLVLWYWNAGRLWLPSLLRSLSWDRLSMRSMGHQVQAHPSLLIGLVFPLMFLLAFYLLARPSRL